MQLGVAFIYSLKTLGNRKPTPGCNGLNFRIKFLRIKCYSESSKIDSSLLWIKYLQSKNSNWNKDELEIMKAENAAHIKDPSSMLQLISRFLEYVRWKIELQFLDFWPSMIACTAKKSAYKVVCQVLWLSFKLIRNVFYQNCHKILRIFLIINCQGACPNFLEAISNFSTVVSILPSIAFHMETSHLTSCRNQMTGFFMKCNTRLKWVNLNPISANSTKWSN